jgi:hypothetical protein
MQTIRTLTYIRNDVPYALNHRTRNTLNNRTRNTLMPQPVPS